MCSQCIHTTHAQWCKAGRTPTGDEAILPHGTSVVPSKRELNDARQADWDCALAVVILPCTRQMQHQLPELGSIARAAKMPQLPAGMSSRAPYINHTMATSTHPSRPQRRCSSRRRRDLTQPRHRQCRSDRWVLCAGRTYCHLPTSIRYGQRFAEQAVLEGQKEHA